MSYFLNRLEVLEMIFCIEIKEKCKKIQIWNNNTEEVTIIIEDIRGYCRNEFIAWTRQINIRYESIFQDFITKRLFLAQEMDQLYEDYK